jgi:hypothetical protein
MKSEDSRLDREWLLRYVLGELSEEETQLVDARFFADETFASMLDETYRDLLDSYSTGEITGNEKQRAERAFFAGPYQGHQLKVLQAIQSLTQKVTAAAPRTSKPWFLSVKPVAVFAALLSLGIAIVWHQHGEKMRESGSRNISADAAVSTKSPEALTAPREDHATAGNIYTILLLPDVTRGNQTGKSFPVPSSVDEIVFQVVLPRNQAEGTFGVRLNSGKHHTQLFSGLKPQAIDGQKYLEFRVGSGELPADDYAVDVFESSAQKNPAEHFVVHVTRLTGHRD